jgi:hypothetical protein
MKALANLGILVAGIICLLSFGFSPLAMAQIEGDYECVPEGGSYSAIQPGGLYIPARDTFHVLVVFVEFPDDAFDVNNPKWPKGQPPEYLNTFVDSTAFVNSQNGNMSHYFREMSMGTFTLTGKGVHVVLSQTRRWYYDNYGHQNIYGLLNRDALLKVDSMISFKPFDRWTRTGDTPMRKVQILSLT